MSRPVRAALRPVRGTVRLALLRVLCLIVASAPAWLALSGALGSAIGSAPALADAEGPLSIVGLQRLGSALQDSLAGLMASAVVVGVLLDAWLTGAAAAWLAPGRPRSAGAPAWSAWWRDGKRTWTWLLRIALACLVLDGLGLKLIGIPFEHLDVHGQTAGDSMHHTMVVLTIVEAACGVAWFGLVAAWGTWTTVVAIADDERRVRRAGRRALGLLVRHPVRGLLLFGVVLAVAGVFPGLTLAAWRQAAPGGGWIAWWGVWLCTLTLQALAWLWTLRAAHLLVAAARGDGAEGVE